MDFGLQLRALIPITLPGQNGFCLSNVKNKPAKLERFFRFKPHLFFTRHKIKILTTSFSHNVGWHDNGIKTPN